jgi:HAD superfamily hydrolase (TIGR01509 family)
MCYDNRHSVRPPVPAREPRLADDCFTMTDTTPLIRPAAILFDMDGTLTAPLLDFDRIKADMGIGSAPILESLKRMPPARRAVAQAVLDRHENQAACDSTLNPGCRELLAWLQEQGIRSAVVTRNTRRSLRTVFDRHGLAIDVCVTRDDGKYKPDPEPLQLACTRLGVSVDQTWMVGDGNHDIEAGVAAGMKTVWISHGKTRPFDAEPWRVISDLPELQRLLVASAQRKLT